MTACVICGAESSGGETCGEHCRLKLECLRVAWDREARKVGVNGYYHRRYHEHLRNHDTRGAKVMLKEWEAAKARLGQRP